MKFIMILEVLKENLKMLEFIYFREFPFHLIHTLDLSSVFCITQCLLLMISSARLKGCLNTRIGVPRKFFLEDILRLGYSSVTGCKYAMLF